MQLKGQSILLTGAGSGIGRALAEVLAKRGAILHLAGRDMDKLRETRALMDRPDQVHLYQADVTCKADRQALIAAIAAMGPLDVLINNAGMILADKLATSPEEDLIKMVETNLMAPILLTKEALGLLATSPAPTILNVGSVLGDVAYPFFAGYSASKFGLRGFSDALRRELKPRGIAVIYIAPRATKTAALPQFAHLASAFAMKLDAPHQVAERIAHRLEGRTHHILPTLMERFFVGLQRTVPGLIDRLLVHQARNLP